MSKSKSSPFTNANYLAGYRRLLSLLDSTVTERERDYRAQRDPELKADRRGMLDATKHAQQAVAKVLERELTRQAATETFVVRNGGGK